MPVTIGGLSSGPSVFSSAGLSSLGSSGERSVISRGKYYRRRKGHDLRILKAIADPAAPSDRRYEDLPRRGFVVTMDNALSSIKLGPGRDGRNAVLMEWFDAIKAHDEIVLQMEEAIEIAENKKRAFLETQRVYENHNIAWTALNENPDELMLYATEWKPMFAEIPDIKKHVKRMGELEKEKLLRAHARYVAVIDTCEKLIPLEETLKVLREAYDFAAAEADAANRALRKTQALERAAASEITEDHVIATDLGRKLHDIFPTLRTGYLVAKINGVGVENQDFGIIMEVLAAAAMPHRLEFRRHDYSLDLATHEWRSYQELRAMGRYAPDPRFERCEFVESCRLGHMSYVRKCLVCGADPDAIDHTGSTGMHHAAAQGHVDLMKMLLENGASIDARNKNLETPLLVATRKGCMKSILWLAEHKANMNALDKQRRSPLIHAIRTENQEVVRYYLDRGAMISGGDFQWGWTALHYAASEGCMEIAKMLIERKANKYRLTKTGLTSEQVAEQCHRVEMAAYLRELVFADPAQKVLWNDEGLQVWLGARSAAHPTFATQIGFEAFLVLNDRGDKDPQTQWLEREAAMGGIDYYSATFKMIPDDRGESSFQQLMLRLGPLLEFLTVCIERNRRLLLCCERGVSTAPAVLCAFLLLKRGFKLTSVLEHFRAIRRQVEPSPSLLRGLQGMEESLSKKKLKRLAARLHKSELLDLPPIEV